MTDFDSWRWLLLACALLVAPVTAVQGAWSYWQLTHDGVEAAGAVTGKQTHHGRRSTSYDVTYRFRDSYGRSWTGSQRISRDRYLAVSVGQPIDVTYCSSDPSVSVAYMSVLRERVGTMSLISLVIALATVCGTWWLQYARRKTREHDAEELGLGTR